MNSEFKINFVTWDEFKYNDYLKYLRAISDEKVADFNKRIMYTNYEILGIKIPVLQKIAKEISKTNIDSFIRLNRYSLFEEVMILGFVIGNIKDKEKFLVNFNNFVPMIDSWAICDSCVKSFKIIKKIDFFNDTLKLIESDYEFIKRVGIIIMLSYYIDENHIDKCLDVISNINTDYYYVNMASAWFIAECFIKYRTNTMELLKRKILPVFVQNKAISKICDSYRVTKEDKVTIKSFKY